MKKYFYIMQISSILTQWVPMTCFTCLFPKALGANDAFYVFLTFLVFMKYSVSQNFSFTMYFVDNEQPGGCDDMRSWLQAHLQLSLITN